MAKRKYLWTLIPLAKDLRRTLLLLMGQTGYRVQLLAPAHAGALTPRVSTQENADLHSHYLSSLQRLRAQAYLEDGAIEPWQVDGSGRFRMEGDEESWHFLLVNEDDQVIACLRLLCTPTPSRSISFA